MIDFFVLGSGISGSTIANLLNKKYSTEIIDKAKGIGGRSSNKKMNKSVTFDHGLQYYQPNNKKFKSYLKTLIEKKVLKIWTGNHIDFTFKKREQSHKIIGVKGNNDLNKYLLKNIKKNLDQEISNIKFKKSYWEIIGKNSKFKSRNIVITFPFFQTKKIAKKYLNQNFLDLKVQMSPNITLLIEQKTKHKVPISSIKLNNKKISWAANENSKKRFSSSNNYWTIQASNNYSKKIINIYKKRKNYFSKELIKEFSNITGLKYSSFKVFKIHGWKYSYNHIGSSEECYWDSNLRIGLCGDWFIGPKAESAWLSANSLFKKIKKNPPK